MLSGLVSGVRSPVLFAFKITENDRFRVQKNGTWDAQITLSLYFTEIVMKLLVTRFFYLKRVCECDQIVLQQTEKIMAAHLLIN